MNAEIVSRIGVTVLETERVKYAEEVMRGLHVGVNADEMSEPWIVEPTWENHFQIIRELAAGRRTLKSAVTAWYNILDGVPSDVTGCDHGEGWKHLPKLSNKDLLYAWRNINIPGRRPCRHWHNLWEYLTKSSSKEDIERWAREWDTKVGLGDIPGVSHQGFGYKFNWDGESTHTSDEQLPEEVSKPNKEVEEPPIIEPSRFP